MVGFGGDPLAAVLIFELADAAAQCRFRCRPLGAELRLPLFESIDGVLALVGVTLRDRAVEDQPADPALVVRGLAGLRCAGITAQPLVERTQAPAGSGVAETDADRVMAQVGAHVRWRRGEARELAEASDLAFGIDEERVVVRHEHAVGGQHVEDRRVVALPQRQTERIGVLVAPLQ